MAGGKIGITVEALYDGDQAKKGLKGLGNDLKKINGLTRLVIEPEIDVSDALKSQKKAIKDAYAAIQAEIGRGMNVINAKGNKVKLRAFQYLDSKGNAKDIVNVGDLKKAAESFSKLNGEKAASMQNLYTAYYNRIVDFGQGRIDSRRLDDRLRQADATAKVVAERRKRIKEEYDALTKDEREAKQSDKRFRREAMEKMKQSGYFSKDEEARANLVASEKAEIEKDRTRRQIRVAESKAAYTEQLQREKELANLRKQEAAEEKKNAREKEKYNKAVFDADVKRRKEQQKLNANVANIEKQIAKERARNVRGGGNLESSILRQIELYRRLADARKKAGDAIGAKNARFHIQELKKQAAAVERLNTLFGRQGRIMTGLQSMAARYFSIYTVARFGEKIAETTGYFQQQQVALEGILRSASKARTVLNDIKSFALQSPFQTKELVTFTKQLAAFGVKDNELFPTVKKLADISAGLGVDMSRIILAYGQVKSAAVLRGQELRQFTEAGIPMVDELAKKFTELNGTLVTTADVFKLISERKVPFEMVAEVLSDLTAEGGKFYKMQENITNTTYGQIQKLKDLWTLALDDIGKSANWFIDGIIKGLQTIVKNIQPIALALTAAFTGHAIGNAISLIYRLGQALKSAARTARLLGTSLSASLGGAIGVAIGAAVGLIWNEARKATETARKMREVSDGFVKDTQKMIDGLDSLSKKITSTNTDTKQYADAISALSTNYGDFISDEKLNALRESGNAAKQAAEGFNILADAIKEAIKQQNNYLSLIAQGDVAADEAAKNSGQNFTRTILGLKQDVLSDWGGYGRLNSRKMPKEIADFVNSQGLTRASFANAIDVILQQTIRDAAKEGKGLNELTELYSDAIKNAYKDIPDETAGRIGRNAFLLTDWKSYAQSLDSYKAANAMTYATIDAPFNKAAKDIAEGAYYRKESKIINDKISAEQETARIWRDALKQSLENAKLTGYANSDLKEIVEDSGKTSYDIHQAMRDFENTEGLTSTELGMLARIEKNYLDNVKERESGGRAEKIYKAFTDQNSEVYKWRNNKELSDLAAVYGAPSDANLQKLREDIVSEKSRLKGEIEQEKDEVKKAEKERRLAALTRLQETDLYAWGDKQSKGSRSGSGGGWQRLFQELFSWIKEARKEEKAIIEGPSGLTGLKKQVNDEKLTETAIRSFYDGSPFAKFINSIEDYDIETDFFSSDLKKNLGDVIAKQIEQTGTVDYKDIWNQLLDIITKRANELEKTNAKAAKALRDFVAKNVLERDKYFGWNDVEAIIEKQLQELREINNNLQMNTRMQGAFERLSAASTDSDAVYSALGFGDKYKRFRPDLDAIAALNTALYGENAMGAEIGKMFADTLQPILSAGELNIQNAKTIFSVISRLQNLKTIEGVDAEPFKKAKDTTLKLLDDIIELYMKEKEARAKAVGSLEKSLIIYEGIEQKDKDRRDEIENYYKEEEEKIRKGLHEEDMSYEDRDRLADLRARKQNSLDEAKFDKLADIMKMYGANLDESLRGFADANSGLSVGGSMLGFMQGGFLDKLKLGVSMGVASGAMGAAEGASAVSGGNMAIAIIDAIFKVINGIFNTLKDIYATWQEYDKRSKIFESNTIRNAKTGELDIQGYDYGVKWKDRMADFEIFTNFNDNAQKGWESFKNGDLFGALWLGLFKQIFDIPQMIAKAQDQRIRNEQEELIRSNENLERAIKQLEHELRRAAGNLKFDVLTEEITNIEQQRNNTQLLYEKELKAKHTDPEKLQEYSDQTAELERDIENRVLDIRDMVFGTADEIASRLTDPLVEAFRNGENAARSWRDAVRTYIGDVLKQMLMTNVVAPKIEEQLEKVGIVKDQTSTEDIEKILMDSAKMLELRNGLFEAGNFLINWFNNDLSKPIQEMIAWNSDTSALSGGIQGITEDTGRTLEGLGTSMLAQLVILNRSASNSEGYAEMQISYFKSLLSVQGEIRDAVRDIRGFVSDSYNPGMRSLKVSMQ